MKHFSAVLLPLLLSVILPIHPAVLAAEAHTFKAENGNFTLDGKPFQVISGEMHYARIPRAYWRDRFKMAKAMGLNTITTYVFWNVHEPQPGVYDFSGNNDVAEFIREAQEEGLYVILRPGPYACAEWEFGGFPSWLLKDHSTVVRSSDPKFMDPAKHWLTRLGQELAPLQIGNGGPIILVQVENEYGSFDKDHAYMEQIHHILVDAGLDSVDKIASASVEDLQKIPGMGPKRAEALALWFQNHRPVVDDILSVGVKIAARAQGGLTGKSVCFTGKSTRKRAELEQLAEKAGGAVKNSVGKGLTFLVLADPASTSSKAEAARKNGTTCISEEDFVIMCGAQ